MRFKCDNGHLVSIETRAEKKMLRKAEKGLVVCPYCKPDNIQLTHLSDNKFSGKQYACSDHHLTIIYPFTNGLCNVEYGDDNENVEAEPESMQEMIDSGEYKCQHRDCKRKLLEVDSGPLSKPSTNAIKTRTRVGDIWDKAGCPEPRDSKIEIETRGGTPFDARLNETEFSRRNRERVKRMREKEAKRNAKPAGEVIDKPTDRSYKEGGARRPKKSDL